MHTRILLAKLYKYLYIILYFQIAVRGGDVVPRPAGISGTGEDPAPDDAAPPPCYTEHTKKKSVITAVSGRGGDW